MKDVKQKIIEDLKKIVKDLTGQDTIPILEHPKDERHGDYSSNIAMAIFASSKFNPSASLRTGVQSSKLRTPLELAQKITEIFNSQLSTLNFLDRVEAVAPGFINFWLSKDYLATLMIRIIRVKDEYGKSKLLENKKIMVEFTDPNPFKEFHIGHLYSNIVGESLARLFEARGAEVKRANYQGDVGMHVAKAIWGMMKTLHRKMPKESDSLYEKVRWLGMCYAAGAFEEGMEKKEELEKINKAVYEQNDDEINRLYKRGREWSLQKFEEIYKRLGTKFDFYFFESEVGSFGMKLVEDSVFSIRDQTGVFERSEGAIVFRAEKFDPSLHTRVFITSKGLPTYEAKELGLAKIKYDRWHYDTSVVVTGNEVNDYFRVLLVAMKLIFPELAEKTHHVSHGMVRLPEGKMSSRTGTIITGEWLLDEAKKRIRTSYKEMGERAAEQVALGAVKYGLLKSGIGRDIAFDFDESISLEGNSGPYLQYTFARTQSVLRKSEIRNPKSETNSNNQNSKFKNSFLSFEHSNFDVVSNFDIRYSNLGLKGEELTLLRTIHRFQEIVEEAAENFAPNLLCNYLFDLSQKFNLFYQRLPILRPVILSPSTPLRVNSARDHLHVQKYQWDSSTDSHRDRNDRLREFRLALTAAVGQIIKNGLYFLGIEAPQRM